MRFRWPGNSRTNPRHSPSPGGPPLRPRAQRPVPATSPWTLHSRRPPRFAAQPPAGAVAGRPSAASARAAPRSRDVAVDLAQQLPAVLPGTDESDRVRVIIMRSSEVLGAVDVVTGGAPVSRMRLSDAIAAFSPKLVDAPRFA